MRKITNDCLGQYQRGHGSFARPCHFVSKPGTVLLAGSRTFVQEGIYNKFVAAMVKKAAAVKVGDYMEANINK